MFKDACIRPARLSILIFLAMAAGASAEPRYTPEHIWSENWEIDFHENWFGGQLSAMGEPSLWQLSKHDRNARVYRVLRLPSFSPALAARLVVQSDGSGTAEITELDGAGGFEPGKPMRRLSRDLAPSQVRDLDALFDRSGFWTGRIETGRFGGCTDGTQFVLEALSLGSYKLISRHECSMEDDVRAILRAFPAISVMPPPLQPPSRLWVMWDQVTAEITGGIDFFKSMFKGISETQ